MSTNFDPYHRWLGIPPDNRPLTHFLLLGISQAESDADVIDAAAERQMSHVRKYALGPNGKHAERLLNELAVAHRCLLDPSRRQEYLAGISANDKPTASSEDAAIPLLAQATLGPHAIQLPINNASINRSASFRQSLPMILLASLSMVVVGVLGVMFARPKPTTVPEKRLTAVRPSHAPVPKPMPVAQAAPPQATQVPLQSRPPSAVKPREPNVVPPSITANPLSEAGPPEPGPRSLSDLLEPPPPVLNPKALPEPDQIDAATRDFEQQWATEVAAARSIPDKAKLAITLLEKGAVESDRSQQYVILLAACRHSVEPSTLYKALQALELRFQGDFLELKIRGLQTCREQVRPKNITKFAELLLTAIAEAEQKDRFTEAEKLAVLGQTVAGSLKDRKLAAVFNSRHARTAEVRELHRQCEASLAAIQVDPKNTKAAQQCAQYVCFVLGNWQQGLPQLAVGPDAALAELAALDLSQPESRPERLKLAERWWQRGEDSQGLAQQGIRRRAVYWYRQVPASALPQPAKITQRLALFPEDELAAWRPFAPEAVLGKQAAGHYQLYFTDRQSKQRSAPLLRTIIADGTFVDERDYLMGRWRIEEGELVIQLLPESMGYAQLQRDRQGRWFGQHHRLDNQTVWDWELFPE